MTRYNAPYLEPYKGRSSRHECPACHDKQSFARYLDGSTGAVIHPSVGRCNHESGCRYHYTPRQYFQDNPTRKEVCTPGVPGRTYRRPILPKEPDYIPKEYLARSLGYGSNFVTFLCSLFAPYTVESPTIARLMSDYYFGTTKDKSIIYWQIDEHNRIRTGKIMQYDRQRASASRTHPGLSTGHTRNSSGTVYCPAISILYNACLESTS